jgi:hypothetical protein
MFHGHVLVIFSFYGISQKKYTALMKVVAEPFDPTSALFRNAAALVCARFRRFGPSDVARKRATATVAVVADRCKVQAAAFVTVRHGARQVHIEYVASRGRGAGGTLVRWLQAQCAARMYILTAEVRLDNPDARKFFEHLGFAFRARNARLGSRMGLYVGCRCCADRPMPPASPTATPLFGRRTR